VSQCHRTLQAILAGGKPVAVTDLEECRQFRGVLPGSSTEAFIQNLAVAMERERDPEFVADLRDAGGWAARIEVMPEALRRATA
jgi:hypothetical protein